MSTSGSGMLSTGRMPPTHQADAVLNQNNPVSGNAYTVLATTANCRIISIGVSVTWTVQPTPLEIVLVIDGVTFTFTQDNPVTATNYFAYFEPNSGGAFQYFVTTVGRQSFLIEGKSVSVTAETTGGTVQNLLAIVRYAKW